MEQRTIPIRVRISEKELRFIKEKAKEENGHHLKNGRMNLSGYIRDCVLEQSGIKKESYKREIKNLSYQIRKIGVNINQVAAKINSGYRGMDAVSTLLENQNRIERELEILLKKLGEENGNHETDEYKTREAGREQTSL